MSKRLTSHSVNSSISALIRSRNSPSVMMMNGIDRNFRTGATNEFTMPRISATKSSGQDPVLPVRPLKLMSSKSHAATASVTALVASQAMNLRKPTRAGQRVSVPDGSCAQAQRVEDGRLGVGEVLEEHRGALDVAALEQHHQRGVAVGLVVGVAPDPVDLGERELSSTIRLSAIATSRGELARPTRETWKARWRSLSLVGRTRPDRAGVADQRAAYGVAQRLVRGRPAAYAVALEHQASAADVAHRVRVGGGYGDAPVGLAAARSSATSTPSASRTVGQGDAERLREGDLAQRGAGLELAVEHGPAPARRPRGPRSA